MTLPVVDSGLLAGAAAPDLQSAFRNPPDGARPWTFWSWQNGHATKAAIVGDLNDMRRRGIGGLVLGYGGGPVSTPTPDDKPFMGPEWTELLRFAVEEAEKHGIAFGMYICSGWNVGGPWVTPEHAAQGVVFSEIRVTGPRSFNDVLAEPKHPEPFYRDIAVLAYRMEGPGKEGGRLCFSKSMTDLSRSVDPSGRLTWQAPDGEWAVLRFGHTIAPRGKTKWSAPGSGGYEVDPFQAEAMDAHFAATVDKLAEGKGPRFLFVDSWEMGKPNWTAKMREEFRRRRGYDPLPYLPVLAKKTVDSPDVTARFEEDFDRTLGDLTVENYYGRVAERAHRHGIRVMMQAAGYQKPCVDSLRAMGRNDVSTGEFWARVREPDGYLHQRSPAQLRFHDSIKLAASAAHIYGRSDVTAEAYTVWNPLWKPLDKDPFAFKDVGDHAFCQGLTNHLFVGYHQRPKPAKPPATAAHFGRHVTWWPMSHAWLKYLARCQFLLRQGQFVADVCYFYGEHVPNYVPSRDAMTPPLPRGYDCDSMNAEVLLGRLSVSEGRLRLPEGTTYRYLVMPHRTWTPPPGSIFNSAEDALPGPGNGLPVAVSAVVLGKIRLLVESGATLVGPPPRRAPGLRGDDKELANLAAQMWGSPDGPAGQRMLGKGRILWGMSLEEIFAADGLPPDFEWRGGRSDANIEYIHRRTGGGDLYFISNQGLRTEAPECVFRVSGRQPELWDPVTGERRDLPEFRIEGGRTAIPMELAPKQSFFVFFRKLTGAAAGGARRNFGVEVVGTLAGHWEVSFDPQSRGPAGAIVFDSLEDWTKRPEEAIRHYSGTARYRKSFDFPVHATAGRTYLDLGGVRNLASVRLNGKDLGVVWCAPWRIEITGVARPKDNRLEIDVVNLWPNRLIGDSGLPPGERPTNTLVYKPDSPLLPSGLSGPVTLQVSR